MEGKTGRLSFIGSPEKLDTKKSFWHINREMLPYKLHFLLFVGGAGAVFPFQSAFGITELGLTASNIAACYTALQVSVFLLKPGIGYLADSLNKLKVVIMGLAVFQAIFSFLMIIIPNTDMPGIHIVHSTNTSLNASYSQLCFNSEAFTLSPPKRYLNEENFRQVSSCLNNNIMEDTFINCSTKYTNNSYEIRQIACNSSLLENNTALEYDNEHSSDILYIISSQHVVCLFPKGNKFYSQKFSSDDLNQYCYALTKETSMKLQELLTESDSSSLGCSTLDKMPLKKEDEHSIGIANFKTYQFWAFAICLVLSCTCGSSQFTMSDTATYESAQGNDYGQQRLWGAVSWGLVAPLAGYLNDYTESFMSSWFICVGFTVLQIWNLSRMNLIKPDSSQSVFKDIKTILSSMEFLSFSSGVFFNGVFAGIISFYLTWFVISIGGNKLVIGLIHTVQCFFGEVPLLYFSSWLIKKLGHFNLVSLALISHGIRFFLYSYLHSAWWILPIECLHGCTLGSFFAAMTSYAKLNSKPGTEATTQSILCAIYEALGCGIGGLITGVCLEIYGGHTTFFYASFLCVIATAINVFFTTIMRCRKGIHDVTDSAASVERY